MRYLIGLSAGFVVALTATAFAAATFTFGAEPRHVDTHERHVVAGSTTLGPTAPSWEVNNSCAGLGFDAAGETSYVSFEIPDCWNGTSDILLEVKWCGEDGDAIANGETVKWDFTYRSLIWGTEPADNGSAVLSTGTYTEAANPGDNEQTLETMLTLDYDHADQPLTAGDYLIGSFVRDTATDTYSGDGIVTVWEFKFTTAEAICDL